MSIKPNFVILEKLGKPLEVLVRRSNKAIHISIKIVGKYAELILPETGNMVTGYDFLVKKEAWIRKKLHNIAAQSPHDENIISILGKPYQIVYIESDNYNVKLTHDMVEIYAKIGLHCAFLKVFLQKILLQEIIKLAMPIAKKYKLNYAQIKLMSNTTKWGSCSSKGILSFHWRLIFAPYTVLEYLVAHEMAHLKEMNHSKKFWALVSKILPDYDIGRNWLKRSGATLHLLLPLCGKK